MCAVTQPEPQTGAVQALVAQSQGQLRGSGRGWWTLSFSDVALAEAFVSNCHAVHGDLSAVIDHGPPNAIAFARIARMVRMAPRGAMWLTPEAGPPGADYDEVPLLHTLDHVAVRRTGSGTRAPHVPSARRAKDVQAIRDLFELGLRVVVVVGAPGSGTSRLLRQLALPERWPYIDLHADRDAWSLLFTLAARLGVPIDERASIDLGVQRVIAGVNASSAVCIVIDHVHDDLLPILRQVVGATSVRWLIAGVERLGTRSEVCYEIGAPEVVEEHTAQFHAVDGHPLACRLLVAASKTSVDALYWVDRVCADGDPLACVRSALPDLVPEGAYQILVALTHVPRSLPLEGIRAVSSSKNLRGDAWRDAWDWLIKSGLVETSDQPGAPVWVSSWVQSLSIQPEQRWEAIRCWARWVVERFRPMLDLDGVVSAPVLEMLAEQRALHDAVVEGLLALDRIQVDDLALLSDVLRVRAYLAVQHGPARLLVEPLEQSLTAVGRNFDVGPDVAIALLRTRAEVFAHLERWDAALADLERAEGLALRQDRAKDLAQIRTLIGTTHLRRGRFDEAEAVLLSVGRAHSRVVADSALGEALVGQGRFQEAHEVLERAQINRAQLGLPERAVLAGRRALVFRRMAKRAEAIQAYQQALQHWRVLGRHREELLTRFRMGVSLQSMGRLAEAHAQYDAVQELAGRFGDQARMGLVLVQKGLVALERNELVAASDCFRSALSAARSGGDRGTQGAATGFLALVLQFQGRIEDARQGYRDALRNLETGRERRFGALFHSCLAATEAELDNLEEARILLDVAALQLPDADQGMRAALGLFAGIIDLGEARLANEEGRLEDAARARQRAQDLVDEIDRIKENVYGRFVRKYLEKRLGG